MGRGVDARRKRGCADEPRAVSPTSARRAAAHWRDIFSTLRDVPSYPPILIVMILQGAVALFIGVALVPLLPDFGGQLGVPDGTGYAVLVSSMAAGAVIAGISLEAIGRIRGCRRSTLSTPFCRHSTVASGFR